MRIFALDDYLATAQGYQSLYCAEPFVDPYELMHALKLERPDLLITDLNLGKTMTGWDVVEQARELYPDLPIIVATGLTEKEQEALAHIKGVDFWAKGDALDGLKILRALVEKYGQPSRAHN